MNVRFSSQPEEGNTEKLLLEHLHEVAVDGRAVVSVPTLAAALKRADRTIRFAAANLEASGCLERFETWHADGRQGPNEYVLRP